MYNYRTSTHKSCVEEEAGTIIEGVAQGTGPNAIIYRGLLCFLDT